MMLGAVLSSFSRSPVLPAAVSLVLMGCGSSPTSGDPSGAGTFNASVTGDRTTTFSGDAVSTVGATGGWVISLTTGGPRSITIVTLNSQRPAVGTYPIIMSVQAPGTTETVFFASFVAETGLGSYTSNSGTLTIQSSSPSSVAGSFTFEGQRGVIGDSLIVNVQGTFNTANTGG